MALEKRNSKRIETKVIVHCMKNSEQGYVPDRFISFTRDLSPHGARIIVSKDIKPGDQFTATLEIPTSFIPLLTFSEAVWARSADRLELGTKSKDMLEAGIRFLKIETPDAEKLKSFLDFKENQAPQINSSIK